MMVQLMQATNVLEIGRLTSYSARYFAEAFPADGTVITCEVDERSGALACQYFEHRRLVTISMSVWG